MQIKIHINDKTLYLCNALDQQLQALMHHPETVFIDELNSHSIKAMLRELTLPEIRTGIFLHGDFEELKKVFFKKFEVIQAAGGLVTNEKNEVLLIFRRGFWDLPKGKREAGETIEDCAVREVQEETGLTQITLNAPLQITYHTYELGTHHILKESHWFLMKATVAEQLIPQTEEDIEQIAWIDPGNIDPYKSNAYASIKDVLTTWSHL
ncbi:MAG: NUDIX domain-containing protein [Niabella sp.]|nr:NUDIX domain-containing protein [Niabella sp.]